MSNSINSGEPTGTDTGESKLRGDGLEGSDSKTAADHPDFLKRRNPDTTVRVDNESDSLYTDGLEIEDDTPPMGTDGRSRDNAR